MKQGALAARDESAKEHVLDAMGLVRHALMLFAALFHVKRALTYVIYFTQRKAAR